MNFIFTRYYNLCSKFFKSSVPLVVQAKGYMQVLLLLNMASITVWLYKHKYILDINLAFIPLGIYIALFIWIEVYYSTARASVLLSRPSRHSKTFLSIIDVLLVLHLLVSAIAIQAIIVFNL